MKVESIENFTRGWFIGNFDPSILKTKLFEVGILRHKKGEEWPCHYHTSYEINYVISGELCIQGRVLKSGDVFMINPYEVADPEFITDCEIVVVKTPSNPKDKFLAQKPTMDEE